MNSVTTRLFTKVGVDQSTVFRINVPIDLESIFTGYGPLPAVIGTENQTGAWDGAGQCRTVLLSDGSSAQETLTKYEYPHYFSYRVSDFTGTLRLLAAAAEGEWWFRKIPADTTEIEWRYTFKSRSFWALPILWVITKVLWRGYMKKALGLLQVKLENHKRRIGDHGLFSG